MVRPGANADVASRQSARSVPDRDVIEAGHGLFRWKTAAMQTIASIGDNGFYSNSV
jgi:hypothetical protein